MRVWLNRQRNLLDFSLSSLSRRRGKTLGMLVVYTAIVFVLASVMLFSHAVRREAATVLAKSPEVLVQRMVAGRHDLIPARHLDAIKGIRGVQTAEGRLWGYLFDPAAAANYTLMVPTNPRIEPGKVVIGDGVVRVRSADPGDLMSFRAHDGALVQFKVESAISRDSALVSADLFLVAEEDFRRLFGIPAGLYTDLAISVRNPREVGKIAEKIDAALPDTRIVLRDEILRTYESVFDWREGMLLVLLAGSVLAFGIFAWEKASGLSAEERREIGILKAVGWETGDVIRLKMMEGLVVSLSAFLVGYLLAYAHVFHLGAGLFEPVLKGWAVLYPKYRLTPFVDELQVATLFFFTVFPYTIATVVPIWRAAIVDPDQVMR
ncbi:ABC-type transport system, involved in lipoprotein release, permease component [Magnetospirillum sp. XM-1]|uniref:ABC transporter permease n=1 Tax=Magnetospirillum sp. XM-1 TaxID=1663591 RepID=UPI00073DC812|nr:FtsX-like permease family protein [Magnetospirillum sp. XM-1]CUW41053.1 ABC-type transport system, involved in lipoprotein release, permease component [Magnetospirillum sp. XM-1]